MSSSGDQILSSHSGELPGALATETAPGSLFDTSTVEACLVIGVARMLIAPKDATRSEVYSRNRSQYFHTRVSIECKEKMSWKMRNGTKKRSGRTHPGQLHLE